MAQVDAQLPLLTARHCQLGIHGHACRMSILTNSDIATEAKGAQYEKLPYVLTTHFRSNGGFVGVSTINSRAHVSYMVR